MSRPTSSASLYSSSTMSSALKTARPAPTGGVASFVRHRQQSPWASRSVPVKEQAYAPPPSSDPAAQIEENPEDDYESDADDVFDDPIDNHSQHEYEGTPYEDERIYRHVSDTPPTKSSPQKLGDVQDGEDRTGHLFDADDTLSFSDTTVTVSQKAKLDSMRLPVPQLEQESNESPAPWKKRGISEDSDVVELPIKPEIFSQNGKRDDANYDDRKDGQGRDSYERDLRDEDVSNEGYPPKHVQQSERIKGEGDEDYPEQYDQRNPGDLEEEIYGEKLDRYRYEDQKRQQENEGLGSLSDDASTLYSASNWMDKPPSKDPTSAPLPVFPPAPRPDIKGKGRQMHSVYFPTQVHSNGSPPPRNRFTLQIRGGNRPSSPQLQRQTQVQQGRITAPGASRRKSASQLPSQSPPQPPLQPQPLHQQREKSGQELNRTSKALESRQSGDTGLRPSSPPTLAPPKDAQPAKETPSGGGMINRPDLFKPLLGDEALAKIESYADLIAKLTSIHVNNQAPPRSPDQLSHELIAMVDHAYPTHVDRPGAFFSKLCDEDYNKAGEIISRKKRELEDKLAQSAQKRRRLAEEMKHEVEEVAKVRVERLKKTIERREKLKGQIGGLLRQGGLDL